MTTTISPSQVFTAPPLTWPEVTERFAPVYGRGLPFFDTLPHDIVESVPPQFAAGRFGGFETTISALATLRGPASIAPVLRKVGPLFGYVIAQIGPELDQPRAVAAYFTLSCMNTARCCGLPVPDDAADVELVWLEQMAKCVGDLPERLRHTVALAACAAARGDLVPVFSSLLGLDQSFTPGRTFGFDLPAFVGYLAVAVEKEASFKDIEPAWRDFLVRYPHKLEMNAIGWPALLWTARAVHSTIRGLAEHQVAGDLNRELSQRHPE